MVSLAESSTSAAPAAAQLVPAALPQPVTQVDYRRLVAQVVTAGAATLAKSVDVVELRKARAVLGDAVKACEPAAADVVDGRCSCASPTMSKAVSSLCTRCGLLR